MYKRPANPIKQPSKVLDIQDYLKEQNERDYVLFVLGVATGYRAGDLVALQIRDIKAALRAGYFRIMEAKKANSKNIRKCNMKPREVVIVVKLEKILKNYIKDKKDYEYMFPSRKGSYDHIGVPRVSNILKEAGEAFGLDNITAHSMRKTYAYCIFVESNYNIVVVKEMLGHSSIEETKRYLGLDRRDYDNYSKSLNALIL
jgi:integrase